MVKVMKIVSSKLKKTIVLATAPGLRTPVPAINKRVVVVKNPMKYK